MRDKDSFLDASNTFRKSKRNLRSPDPHGFAREAAEIFNDDPFFNDEKDFNHNQFDDERDSWTGSMNSSQRIENSKKLASSDAW